MRVSAAVVHSMSAHTLLQSVPWCNGNLMVTSWALLAVFLLIVLCDVYFPGASPTCESSMQTHLFYLKDIKTIVRDAAGNTGITRL